MAVIAYATISLRVLLSLQWKVFDMKQYIEKVVESKKKLPTTKNIY